jgi:hypothetical protein
MLNPDIKIAKSKGVDLPILHVYLAGRICGEHIDKCLKWRQDIINHYKNYKKKEIPVFNFDGSLERIDKEYEAYPISFLCPLNSGEATSVDKKGLTSSIPPNLIYDKDILSVLRADVIVANMEDFFEEDIKSPEEIDKECCKDLTNEYWNVEYENLYNKILNRRENIGTHWELAIAHYLKKPIILIVPERRQEIFRKHPFTKRASVIVTSVNQLLEEKWLQILYKAIAGAIYE